MNDLTWRKQTVFGNRDMWQCTVDGDVWTLSQGARSIDGCKNWKVERYSHGTRTRFATMPTLRAAAAVVVRFVNDR